MMKKIIYFLSSLVLVVSCVEEDPVLTTDTFACQTTLVNTHPHTDRFQKFIDEKVQQGIPGITMLIQTPEGIWSGASGVADIPNNIAMKPCNLQKAGSITKTFTGTIILKLVEQGQLNLDDPVSMYLSSSIVNKVANAETATIRQLLSHTSGITDYLSQISYQIFDPNDNPMRVWTAMEELEYIFDEPADFSVGTKMGYSNTNFLLLGMIAEHITNISGEQLYMDLIYSPLGLDNTYMHQNGNQPQGLVRGYFDEFGDGSFIDITPLKRFSNSMVGGITSNVEDLNTFLRAAMTPNDLFSQATIDEMITIPNVPFVNDDFNFGDENKVNRLKFGLSWAQLDTDYGIAYGFSGGFNGRRARMFYFPESQSSIVYMYNGSGSSISSVESELFNNEMVELLFE